MDELKLAALLASRLCHDMVGPIGAINNGVELLADEDDEGMREQALDLVSASAGEAARRLQFYRLAFGAAAGMGAEIGLADARSAAEGLFLSGKVRLDWPPDNGAPLDKTVVKLLLNLVQLGGGTLIRGGTLSVRVAHEAGALRLTVAAAGPRAMLNEDTRAALAGEVPDAGVDAHNVQPWYAARIAASLGGTITARIPEEGRVELSATL